MAFEDRIRLPALNFIHRRLRLLNLLTEFVDAGHRLITVYAPSGYGKSILLADFAQTTDLPVCWCSLQATDRDPAAFLALLAFSITDRFHEIEAGRLFRLIERGDTQNSVRHIADSLNHVGPHVIILDDYHKANSAGTTLALNRLLDQLPERSTLILAARGDMALETGQVIDLLVSERATGLSEEELRFTPEELQLLTRKRFGRQIDLATAEEMARATDGNIAQVLLAGHIMHSDQIVGRLRQRLGDDRGTIYHYLAEEVLSKQPPELQRFMLHTSVLPDMTAELCNELLETGDAQACLEALVRKDLFIARVGAGFRYHDLFAEFLRAKLAEDAGRYRDVSIRAARLLTDWSRFEEAMPLYLAVQAWDEAVALLENKGALFYDTGRALTLNDWFTQIPEPELADRPRLLLWRGQILNNDLGQIKQAMSFFEQAEARFLGQGDAVGAAEAQVWQSVGLRMGGWAKEALAAATRGLEQLEALHADERVTAWAIRNRGLAYATAGRVAEGLSELRRALEHFEALNDTYQIGLCHHDIGICLGRQGNIRGAEHHFRQAIRIWEALGNANDLANTLNNLGVSLHTTGRYDEALEQFQQSLGIALQIGATRRAAFAQAGIGDVYLERREHQQAVEAYGLSSQFAQEADARSVDVYNLVRVGEAFYRQGDLAKALELACQAGEIAAETALVLERGLAAALQARIYMRRMAYADSFDLFREALKCFSQGDVLEQAKVRLWWGYALLLDLRASAALEQLQEAIRLALGMGELVRGLGPSVAETKPLLLHFVHRADMPAGLRDSISLLLAQSRDETETPRPNLQVFTFGSPVLVVAGEQRRFSQRGRLRKMPEFLAYLLLEGRNRGCRWGEISAALWPELEPDKASINFHQTVKRLRDGVLGAPDYIVVQDDYYQVNPRYLEWCDALAFETLFERAVGAPADEALALQLELVDLYRGEFLAGFEVGEWGMAYRARCEDRFLQVAGLAAEQLLRDGAPAKALAVIRRGLAEDYFREDLHRSAFKAYAHLGLQQPLAAHYAELRETFERELAAPPEPATEQLYRQLTTKRRTI
jgi:ATP/maltotriose-dependent transcriptional regulator MalT/DNA-binding SARP family transcriptional activator